MNMMFHKERLCDQYLSTLRFEQSQYKSYNSVQFVNVSSLIMFIILLMIMTPYIKLHYKWVVLFSSFLNSLNFEPPCSFLHDKRQSHLLILICMMWTNEIKSHSAMIKVHWQANVFVQWRNKYEIVIQMCWKIM